MNNVALMPPGRGPQRQVGGQVLPFFVHVQHVGTQLSEFTGQRRIIVKMKLPLTTIRITCSVYPAVQRRSPACRPRRSPQAGESAPKVPRPLGDLFRLSLATTNALLTMTTRIEKDYNGKEGRVHFQERWYTVFLRPKARHKPSRSPQSAVILSCFFSCSFVS